MALANASFTEILDDLSSRFIINVPEEELASVERICFQIEQAHWFYEDFVREQNPSLPSFNLKNFSAKFFKHCPLLHQWSHEHEKAFADFMQYKIRVPVCGAIMLNDTMEKCVLVKGWTSRSGWGFPKGKINKDEPDSTCAAREVLEETGYDISPLIKEQDYVELTIREQRIRLYIVVGVSENTEFCPKTRKEISKIEWHKVADLPTWIKSRDRDTPYHCGGGCVKYGSSRFYMVVPFVSKLRNWLRKRKIALKKAAETSNQEESSDGHATITNVKETSPETSVPGTESESSPHEQSPNISAQFNQSSPQITDSQNILNSIIYLNRPRSTQKTKDSSQNNSYFSTRIPVDQSPRTIPKMVHSDIDIHSTSFQCRLPENDSLHTTVEGELNARNNYLKDISRINSQIQIQNKHNHDITAPIPIHANTNVAIAALDPEQKLRRNSLLNLFAASTFVRPSSSTPASSAVEYDTLRKSSLLSVLQPEPSVINSSKNLTRDDIAKHQLQQSKVQYYPDTMKSPNDNVKNDFMFQNENPLLMNSRPDTLLGSTSTMNLRYPVNSRSSSQNIMTQKISPNIGHIGQGRPSNNSDNGSCKTHEVARKLSLLGLFSTASNGSHVVNVSSVVNPVNPVNASKDYQQLEAPGLHGIQLHTNITESSTKSILSQDYERTIDESDTISKIAVRNNRFVGDYIQNDYNQDNIDHHEVFTNLQAYDKNSHFVEMYPDLRVRHELPDRIHLFVPPGNNKSQENNLCYAQLFDKNPMTSFKFDVEKIVAAL